MTKTKSADKRLNLDLGRKSYAALSLLQKDLEASSKAEVIRDALLSLKKLVDESKKGGVVVVERQDGRAVEIDLRLPQPDSS